MKALLLLSTGIDSPVAGMMMRHRGWNLEGLTFINHGEEEDKAQTLARHIDINTLHTINLAPIQKAFKNSCNCSLQCIFCKRMMLRLAQIIADQQQCTHLITGDNLGQVASQTLENMKVINEVTTMTILRPLLALDKVETIRRARAHGTYEISIRTEPKCPFIPQNPKTTTKSHIITDEETRLDLEALTSNALETHKIKSIK
ncbi:MAG: hypothetical protein ACQESG_03295 [Nanobdellota archaeon]